MEMQIAGVTDFVMISLNDYQTVKNFGHIRYLVALSSHQLLLMTGVCNTFAFVTTCMLDAK